MIAAIAFYRSVLLGEQAALGRCRAHWEMAAFLRNGDDDDDDDGSSWLADVCDDFGDSLWWMVDAALWLWTEQHLDDVAPDLPQRGAP